MVRTLAATSAAALIMTPALAQNTIDRAGTGPNETIEANAPRSDRLGREEFDRLRADYRARFLDYDDRLADAERRLADMEERLSAYETRGVDRAGTGTGGIVDANQPEQEVIE